MAERDFIIIGEIGMHPSKYIWAVRALIYKVFLGSVGNLTYIGKPCFIEGRKRIFIGSRTRIFPGVRMEAIRDGRIIIGNNIAIEQNVHITSLGSDLIIGDNSTISANVFLTNLDHMYEDVETSVMDQGHILRETKIGEGCFIGYGAAIQAGTVLGTHCVVGTNAVVRGTFPDYSVIVGCPAKIVKQYSVSEKKWIRVGEK